MTAYQKYQLQWMIDHDHSLDEMISEMLAMQTDGDKVVFDGDVADLYSDWEYSSGFGGEIWVCEAEWKQCEAQADPPELSDALNEQIIYDDKDYEVIEVCPNCEKEVDMLWNPVRNGYQTKCPYCGGRLMLCDLCQHRIYGDSPIQDCDYCMATDTCKMQKGVNK